MVDGNADSEDTVQEDLENPGSRVIDMARLPKIVGQSWSWHMTAAVPEQGKDTSGEQSPTKRLAGLRVIVVEDSFLAAASIARMLIELQCKVVGPVSTVEKALALIESDACDAAVLDINLSGQTSEPIAEVLAQRGLPYFFVTGYASPMLLSPRQRAHQRIHKPIAERELRDALIRSLETDR